MVMKPALLHQPSTDLARFFQSQADAYMADVVMVVLLADDHLCQLDEGPYYFDLGQFQTAKTRAHTCE
jgi:hypothetical protein